MYPGKASRAYFLKVGLSENQLIHVPHAVDGERFSENDAERKNEALAKRIEWGIPEKARVFLFVGKLESKKAPDRLLDAFITLNNKSLFNSTFVFEYNNNLFLLFNLSILSIFVTFV